MDGRSDQFSLAVIAYELLTGEKPFTADSIPALAFKIVQEEPPQVHRLNPTLEWPVDTVLKRALSKNPADRYPTCSDFAFAIENACRSSKKWKPVPAGALQNLPTLSGRRTDLDRAPAAKPAAGWNRSEADGRGHFESAGGNLPRSASATAMGSRLGLGYRRWGRDHCRRIFGALPLYGEWREERNAAAPSRKGRNCGESSRRSRVRCRLSLKRRPLRRRPRFRQTLRARSRTETQPRCAP